MKIFPIKVFFITHHWSYKQYKKCAVVLGYDCILTAKLPCGFRPVKFPSFLCSCWGECIVSIDSPRQLSRSDLFWMGSIVPVNRIRSELLFLRSATMATGLGLFFFTSPPVHHRSVISRPESLSRG